VDVPRAPAARMATWTARGRPGPRERRRPDGSNSARPTV